METPHNEPAHYAEIREVLGIKSVNERKPVGVPAARVTIFIETDNKIEKIEIPEAHHLNIENRYKDEGYNGIRFTLECEPQYDIDRNCYLTEEIRTVQGGLW